MTQSQKPFAVFGTIHANGFFNFLAFSNKEILSAVLDRQ